MKNSLRISGGTLKGKKIPKDPVPANKSRQTHSLISNCSQLKRISLSLLDVGLRDSLKSNGIFLPFSVPPDILKLFFLLLDMFAY